MGVHGSVLLLRPLPGHELMLTTYRRMGLDIVVADEPSSPFAGLGDHFLPVPDLCAGAGREGWSELVEAVTAFHDRHPVSAVVTTLDHLLPVVGRINQRLRLRGVSATAGEHCSDRRLQRKALADAGVRSPRFDIVSSLTELHAVADGLGYPLVLKTLAPEYRRVLRIAGRQELDTALDAIGAAASSEGLLLEEYIDGQDIGVEAVTFGGHTTVMAVSDRTPGPPPHLTGVEIVVPGTQPSDVCAEAARQTAAALAALGVTDGVTHTELRATSGGPVVLEVNGRVAGGHIADMVEDTLGVNLYEQHWRALTGWAPRSARMPRGHCAARALDGGAGRLRAVGLGRVPPWPSGELRAVRLGVRPGDLLAPVTSSGELRGWVVARGPDAEAARRAADRTRREIRFLCD